ncbi:MAG: InlB B-repeat-containing protein, partial [Halanaerobiales bacterium]
MHVFREDSRIKFIFLCLIAVFVISGCSGNGPGGGEGETEYTLKMKKEGEGELIPPAGEKDYPEDETVDLSAAGSDDYRFYRWRGDAADVYRPETSVLMTDDRSVTGIFDTFAEGVYPYDLTHDYEGVTFPDYNENDMGFVILSPHSEETGADNHVEGLSTELDTEESQESKSTETAAATGEADEEEVKMPG